MKLRRVSYHNSPALQSKYICPIITAEKGQIKKEKIFIGKTGYMNLVVLHWRKAVIAAARNNQSASRPITSKKNRAIIGPVFTLYKEG